MLSLLHTDAHEALATALADPDLDVPATLYGPAWREAIAYDLDARTFRRARGFPKPVYVVRYLGPLLSSHVAHDGRDRGNDSARSAGWWARSDRSEPWAPVSLGQIVTALSEVADDLLTRAQHQHGEAATLCREIRTESPPMREHRSRLHEAEADAERLSAVKACASSLSGLLAGGPSRFGEVARVVREDPDRFGLPEAALVDHVGAWFAKSARAHGWGTGARARVKSSDVWGLYRDTPRALPQPKFFALLDRAIGPRIRDREYPVPPWVRAPNDHDHEQPTDERKSA